MPRGMSDDVSNVIVQALSRGLSRGQISGVVGVSKRAITRINANLKKHGTAKAPPSGAKLGRPVKLDSGQAEAMIGWMIDRNYTFYVKDLVQFLRNEHEFIGCEGTVRRGLLKAGFKRKLPWHKSEITTWIPPDQAPSIQAEADADGATLSTLESPESNIDPAINQIASPQMRVDSRHAALPPPDEDNIVAMHPPEQDHQTRQLEQMPHFVPPSTSNHLLDPILQESSSSHLPHEALPRYSHFMHNPLPDTHLNPQTADPMQLATRVMSLEEEVMRQQDQNARQQDLIAQLQRQLAESQAHISETAQQSMVAAQFRGQVAQYSSPYASMPGAGDV